MARATPAAVGRRVPATPVSPRLPAPWLAIHCLIGLSSQVNIEKPPTGFQDHDQLLQADLTSQVQQSQHHQRDSTRIDHCTSRQTSHIRPKRIQRLLPKRLFVSKPIQLIQYSFCDRSSRVASLLQKFVYFEATKTIEAPTKRVRATMTRKTSKASEAWEESASRGEMAWLKDT